MKTIVLLVVFSFVNVACKKDCLEKDKCSPSTYLSTYLVEQETPISNGITYYIDADKGRKNNSGTSIETPFKSIKQLNELTFQSGDHILFKRGQYHFGEFKLEESGTETSRIYIAAYGSGELPIIKSEDGSKGKGDAKTIYLFNANYITIQNLNIHGGVQSILLDGADYIIIEGCRIGENAESGIRATGRYSETNGSDFGIVRYCLIYSGKSGNIGDEQSTDGIQLMDGASNWHIYNNEFKAWAHSALSIKHIYTNLKSNNNLAELNYFNCGDLDYMRAFDFTGADHLVENNIFQRNIVRNQTVTSHLHGNNNTVAYNLFIGLKTSTASSQPWAIDLHVFIGNTGGVKRKEYVCYNNSIVNNLFYNWQTGSGIRVLTSKKGTINQVHDNSITNNLFYNVGKAIDMDFEPTNIVLRNNLFFNEITTTIAIWNNTPYNLADFETLTGTNGFVIENNLNDNPLLFDPTNENFHLTSSSLAIDSGIDIGFSQDYDGKTIVDNPDIGAFEY